MGKASLFERALRKAGRIWRNRGTRRKDFASGTYADQGAAPEGDLGRYFTAPSPGLLEPFAADLSILARHYLEHRFCLLGSGWVRVEHGMACAGLEDHRFPPEVRVEPDRGGSWLKGRVNASNLEESQRLWALVDAGYAPIDWQLDFKSGYRWRESTWYHDVTILGNPPGADIKVPWELSRMQHLPQLAWAFLLGREGKPGFRHPEAYAREFRNQVLDFIATNPPRFGVNWASAMDVGIRLANWLAAYDFFVGSGAGFDPGFLSAFRRSIFEHGSHIVANLEWAPESRGNHYLANIAGLVFASVYLPRSPDTDAWLAFGVQELMAEVEYQFNCDGSNFETSTCYHRLSAEMVAYAAALILSLPEARSAAFKEYDCLRLRVHPPLKPGPLSVSPAGDRGGANPFPARFWERLEKMAEFTFHLIGPDHGIPQIGDNDNGRFFKFHPVHRAMTVAKARALYLNLSGYSGLPDEDLFLDEDHLDHRHLVAALNGFFGREDLDSCAGSGWLDFHLVRGLCRGTEIPSYARMGPSAAATLRVGSPGSLDARLAAIPDFPGGKARIQDVPVRKETWEELALFGYPDFGLYIYRWKGGFLSIRCRSDVRRGNGAHVHADQLSIELVVDGVAVFRDPGTYLYTPIPDRRNQFRSTAAHPTPRSGAAEMMAWKAGSKGLFAVERQCPCDCLYFQPDGLVACHRGFVTGPVYRIVRFLEGRVSIRDHGGEAATPFPFYSNGYGSLSLPETRSRSGGLIS